MAECGSLAGCRALEVLGSVDVALLDLMLPDGDGAELIAVLRGADPGVLIQLRKTSFHDTCRMCATTRRLPGPIQARSTVCGGRSRVARIERAPAGPSDTLSSSRPATPRRMP